MNIFSKIPKAVWMGVAAVVVVVLAVVIFILNGSESYRQIKVYEIDGMASVSREDVGELEP